MVLNHQLLCRRGQKEVHLIFPVIFLVQTLEQKAEEGGHAGEGNHTLLPTKSLATYTGKMEKRMSI